MKFTNTQYEFIGYLPETLITFTLSLHYRSQQEQNKFVFLWS